MTRERDEREKGRWRESTGEKRRVREKGKLSGGCDHDGLAHSHQPPKNRDRKSSEYLLSPIILESQVSLYSVGLAETNS